MKQKPMRGRIFTFVAVFFLGVFAAHLKSLWVIRQGNSRLLSEIDIQARFVTEDQLESFNVLLGAETNGFRTNNSSSSTGRTGDLRVLGKDIYLLARCRSRISGQVLSLTVRLTAPQDVKGIEIQLVPPGNYLPPDGQCFSVNRVLSGNKYVNASVESILETKPQFDLVELETY